MADRRSNTSLLAIGWLLIALGIAANKWVIVRLFIPDGNIESATVEIAIIAVQLMIISLGVLIIILRDRSFARLIADVCIGILLTIGVIFAVDWGMQWVGFPARYIPPLAHAPNVTTTIQNLEFTYTIQTNSRGIRHGEIPRKKPPGTRRIVVVGDSFTEGMGVAVDETFVSLLESRLSTPEHPTEVINCGLSATSPMQYARILFHICLDYEPDAVIIALYANDVTETVTSAVPDHIDAVNVKYGLYRILHALWPRVYTVIETATINATTAQREYPVGSSDSVAKIDMIKIVSQAAREKGIAETEIDAWRNRLPPALVEAVNCGEFNGQLLSAGLLNPMYWSDSLDINNAGAEQQYAVMISLLDETIHRLQNSGIAAGVVFIPSAFQYDASYGDIWRQSGVHTDENWATTQTELERRLANWAKMQQTPFLDLTPTFRGAIQSSDRQLYYPLDGHWTPEGHKRAAEAIEDWIALWTE